jgi:hypothetical protein
MALLAYGASQRNESGGCDVDSIGAQGNRLGYITAVSDSACDYNGSLIPDTLLSQAVIHGSKGQFNGNANVITDDLGCRARSASQAIEDYNVRSCPHHATGDSC